jgi:hypothetical protein
LSFFRLGKRKNVVVVETVCVVVVVAYTPWSPRLPSDRDDSDSRDTGNAKVDPVSSPYAGGATVLRNFSGSSNVMRDTRAL